jgi:flagellar biogenesis protein FliO
VTNNAAISGGLPDLGASFLRVIGALGVVIAVFLIGVWLFKNWQRLALRRGVAPKLNVLEVRSLGPRQALYVVAYEQKRMLIASSSAGVTMLTHLPVGEREPPPAAPAAKISFAEAFQQVLARKS